MAGISLGVVPGTAPKPGNAGPEPYDGSNPEDLSGVQLPPENDPVWDTPLIEDEPKVKVPAFIARAQTEEKEQRLLQAQESTATLPAPDEAAKLRQEAQAKALPFTSVLADPKQVEPKSPAISWSAYANNEPLSDVLLDPEKAVLVKDEADRLARLAGFDKNPAPGNRFTVALESGRLALEQAHLWTKKGMSGGALSPQDEERLTQLDARLMYLPQPKGMLDEAVGMLPMIGGNLVAGAGGAATGAALGLVGGPGASAFGGALGARAGAMAFNADQMIGMNYMQYTKMGMPHDVAWPAALIAGVTAAGIDTVTFGLLAKLPALKLIEKMPGAEALSKTTIGPAMAAALKDSKFLAVLKTLAKDAGTGAAGNAMQEAVGILGAYAANTVAGGQYQTPTAAEATARVLHAAELGGAVGAAFGGAATVFHETLGKLAAAEQSRAVVENLYAATENLKSSDRAPDVVAEYGNRIAKNGEVKYLTLPVEELDKLIAATPEKNPGLEAWLKKHAGELDEARTNGVRVTVPVGDFVAYIRPLDKAKVLLDAIGVNDEMSAAEAKALKPAIEKARKEMEDINARKKFIEGQPETLIARDLEQKLLKTGATARSARLQSELVASGVSTLARRAGKDPWETFQNAKLDITRTKETTLPSGTTLGGGIVTDKPIEIRGFLAKNKELTHFSMTLTGKARLSTFLHESGHYLFDLMSKLETESPGTFTKDFRVLEEWAGVKEGAPWHNAALEKFAKGMETYFGEGRAPSAKLERAFATFKSWILHVYRVLSGTGVELTDEVRRVMDRMLATDNEIAARRIELGLFPSEELIKNGDMTPEQVARYRELYEKGARGAQAKLDVEAIAALKKEKTAEYKRVSDKVEEDLNRHPGLAARDFLTGGDGGELGRLVSNEFSGTRKLNADLVRAALKKEKGAPAVAKLKDMMTEVGGIDPGELAPYFGFKSAREMLEQLRDMPARQTMKSALVKAEFTKLHPGYGPDPSWVEREALAKLHGEDSIANAIEVELRTIYKKVGLEAPESPALVAKRAAELRTRDTAVGDLHDAKWREAETRFLREQQEALAAKDFQAAAEATRKRLYARAMWQEVQKAQKAVERAQRIVQRFAGDDTLARLGRSSNTELVGGERVGSVLRDAAQALVESLGFREPSDLASFDTHLHKLEEAGLPVSVDPELRERPLEGWMNLSVHDAIAAKDALKNIAAIARGMNEIRLGDQRVRLDTIADDIERSLSEAKLLGRLGEKGEESGTVGQRLRQLRAQVTKPETIAIDIDGGKPGAFHKAFIQSAEEGQFERDRRFRMRRDELRELGAKYRPEGWAKTMKEEHRFVDGRTYRGSEVFTMLLNFGSASNRDKLLRGMERAGRNGWTEENVLGFIHEVFPDRAAYDYAQAILSYISKSNLWEDAAKVREAIAGVRPEKVEGLSIPTPDGGSIEGGYYPLVYDRRVPLKEAEAVGAEALDAMQDSNPLNLYAANGFTKGRTNFAAPILLKPEALAAHIYEVDHFISNAQGIIDRHNLLQHPRIKRALIHSLGFDYWEQLKQANNYIAADGRQLTRELLQLSSITDKLIFHNALLTMGGNILSGVNQVVTGLPATITYLGPKGLPAFARALGEFVKNPFQTWKDVAAASGEIEGMDFHYDRDLRLVIAREMTGENWDHIKSRIAATTMTPVVFGQKMVNIITWKAAQRLAMEQGLSPAEQVAHANSVVRQSQSASAPKDFTAVQRSKDGLMRVLTTLASYTFTLNDMVMPRRLTKSELIGCTERLVALTLTTAMSKALFDVITPKLEEKDSERRKGVLKAAEESEIPGLLSTTEALSSVLGNVPVVGRPLESLATGRPPRFASWVDSGIRAMQSAPDAFSDKGLGKGQLKAVADAVGLATGVPTRHLFFAPGEFAYEFMNDNLDTSPWAFFQELALVRPGQKGEKKK